MKKGEGKKLPSERSPEEVSVLPYQTREQERKRERDTHLSGQGERTTEQKKKRGGSIGVFSSHYKLQQGGGEKKLALAALPLVFGPTDKEEEEERGNALFVSGEKK